MQRLMLLTTALALSVTACSSDPGPAPSPAATTDVVGADAATDPGTDLELGDEATLVWQPTATSPACSS